MIDYNPTTHILVHKNGYEEALHLSTWNSIKEGTDGTRDGYTAVPTTPPEVLAMAHKPIVAEKVKVSIAPEGEFKPEGEPTPTPVKIPAGRKRVKP